MLQKLISLPLELQFGVVIFLGILFVLTLKMKNNNNFKEKILKSKSVKNELVKYIQRNLDALNYLSKKLINDKEIIFEFNTETAILALKASHNIQNLSNKLVFLDDSSLSSLVETYANDATYIISSIYNIENDIYEQQKKHQQLLRQYEREFYHLTQMENLSDKTIELKKAFKEEMSAYKEKLSQLEKTYTTQREELAQNLNSLLEKNFKVQHELNLYKKREIDAKKLYVKQLVYA